MSSQFTEFTQPGQKPVVNSIFDFSAESLGQLRLWLEQNPPAVPITSVLGFSQFKAQVQKITSNEGTGSHSYVDLATVGPEIDGLPDGQYVFVFGGQALDNVAGGAAWMSLSMNGSTPVDSDGCSTENQTFSTVVSIVKTTLSGGGNNTVKCQYKEIGTSTASFKNRFLFGLKFANP